MKQNNTKNHPYVNDEHSRLISIRLEPRIVEAIDRWVRGHPNYTRTEVIERLLLCCLSCATPIDFEDMVTNYHPDPNKFTLAFQSVKGDA